MVQIRRQYPELYNYLKKIPPDTWAVSQFKRGRHLANTTNAVESFWSSILAARYCSDVVSFFHKIYQLTMDKIAKTYSEASNWPKELTPYAQRHIATQVECVRKQNLQVHQLHPGTGITPATIRNPNGSYWNVDGNTLSCNCQARTIHALSCPHLVAYFLIVMQLQNPLVLVSQQYYRSSWLTGIEKAGGSEPAHLNFQPIDLLNCQEWPNDFLPPLSYGTGRGRPPIEAHEKKRSRRSVSQQQTWADFLVQIQAIEPGTALVSAEECQRIDWTTRSRWRNSDQPDELADDPESDDHTGVTEEEEIDDSLDDIEESEHSDVENYETNTSNSLSDNCQDEDQQEHHYIRSHHTDSSPFSNFEWKVISTEPLSPEEETASSNRIRSWDVVDEILRKRYQMYSVEVGGHPHCLFHCFISFLLKTRNIRWTIPGIRKEIASFLENRIQSCPLTPSLGAWLLGLLSDADETDPNLGFIHSLNEHESGLTDELIRSVVVQRYLPELEKKMWGGDWELLAFCALFQVSATLVTMRGPTVNIILIHERCQSIALGADRHLKLVYFSDHYRILQPYVPLPPRRMSPSLATRGCATEGCQSVIAGNSDQQYCSLCRLYFDRVTEDQEVQDQTTLSSSSSLMSSSRQDSASVEFTPTTHTRRTIPRSNTRRIPSALELMLRPPQHRRQILHPILGHIATLPE